MCETYMKGSANRASLRAQKALLLQNELGFKSKFYRKWYTLNPRQIRRQKESKLLLESLAMLIKMLYLLPSVIFPYDHLTFLHKAAKKPFCSCKCNLIESQLSTEDVSYMKPYNYTKYTTCSRYKGNFVIDFWLTLITYASLHTNLAR